MSCVNSFVIRTISCSPAISQFQPKLTTFHSVTFLIFSQLCYFFWHKLIFLTFHSHSNELGRPNFHPSCVDNLNIHALLRGKAFKNIYMSFFVLCHVVSVWHGLVKALTVSNNLHFQSSVTLECVFQTLLSHLRWLGCRELLPVWCHKGVKSQVPEGPWSDQIQVSVPFVRTTHMLH